MVTRGKSFPVWLSLLIAVQVICATFFVADVINDWFDETATGVTFHVIVEMGATMSLLAAIILEAGVLRDLVRRKVGLEQSLADVSAEVHDVISGQFEAWRLSPAETDIAMFLVKGLGTQEIADLRGSAEGTVKAHFNAIFRKAGVHSRAELLSLLIDRLLGGRLESNSH